MSAIKKTYKVFRSILFTAIMAAGVLYLALYVLLSIPGIQNSIRSRAEQELSKLFNSKVKIGEMQFSPFNELTLYNVNIYTPEGAKCISAETIGAGIHLWHLIKDRKIEITYAQILGLNGKIWQKKEGDKLNIQFIIDAFAPKDKNKPPTQFDLKIRNIVIRQSAISFDKLWRPATPGRFNPDHIALTDFKADITLPKLKNDEYTVDVRRLAFIEKSGIRLDKLTFKADITPKSLSVKDLMIAIGESTLATSDFLITFNSFKKIMEALESGDHFIEVIGEKVCPRDFNAFYPPLDNIDGKLNLTVSLDGNLRNINKLHLSLSDMDDRISLNSEMSLSGLNSRRDLFANLRELKLSVSRQYLESILRTVPGVKENIRTIASRAGDISLDINGSYEGSLNELRAEGNIVTSIGELDFDAGGYVSKTGYSGDFDVTSDSFNIGTLLDNPKLNAIALNVSGDVRGKGKNIEGKAEIDIPFVDFNNTRFNNITAHAEKQGNHIFAECNVDDNSVILGANSTISLDGPKTATTFEADIRRLSPAMFGILGNYRDYMLSAYVNLNVTGNNINNITGDCFINSLSFINNEGTGLNVSDISLTAERTESGENKISLKSDFVDTDISGIFNIAMLANGFKKLLALSIPALIPFNDRMKSDNSTANFKATIKPDDNVAEFFKLPVKPLEKINIAGNFDFASGSAQCSVDAPYILQGTKKLIAGTKVNINTNAESGTTADIAATIPVKNDRMNLKLSLSALNNDINNNLAWTMVKDKTGVGNVALRARLVPLLTGTMPGVELTVLPSTFAIGKAVWNVAPSHLSYNDKRIRVDGIRIWHEDQFVRIGGVASADPSDILTVSLANIDLKYIFDTLNINYVTFGGIATGELFASKLFSKEPSAYTDELMVRKFSYNDAVLGNALIKSNWNNEEKEVEIHADIKDAKGGGAKVDGGVFVTRDSLSFAMDADKVNIKFLQPFMAAFTSDVGGRASGNVKLFGTFSDIDLTGRVFADTIYMKVDQTNVYYHGSDSVYLDPGNIRIPSFRLYDRYGNSALMQGYVKHRYFHDPVFGFTLQDARNLLCFDTNSKINPNWYGTIYASGNGRLTGRPGLVSIMMDMTTAANSEFTFVLSETQTALDYGFLTFSDKKKEELESVTIEETLEDKYYRKHEEQQQGAPSIFAMNLRASITPSAKLTLIMDPKAGDKITAHGSGSMQLGYDTESDEISMYGKYAITEGTYNFSLQDLILRDFTIKPGSSIAFNGDPYQAILNITAAYRVNTNLSDLDKSFSTDKDLNRTNVPVDALLNVTGDLQHPEITFDIALPTLTSDVERKVKSIISTDDMMSRQIIYLLALQRFYTPEYMGSGSNGSAELASVASSTISSQLSNMLGQLTDKVTLSPSFRSDRGDFSDMEVDVSLSSKLLNNRLLINGNFGYRDKSSSQTTFIGDFDIEYLLNKNGNLRLKAYNHFNDQYYYLKSALTTQGIGIIYRRDFDNPFTFLKRRKKKSKDVIKGNGTESGASSDSIKNSKAAQ